MNLCFVLLLLNINNDVRQYKQWSTVIVTKFQQHQWWSQNKQCSTVIVVVYNPTNTTWQNALLLWYTVYNMRQVGRCLTLPIKLTATIKLMNWWSHNNDNDDLFVHSDRYQVRLTIYIYVIFSPWRHDTRRIFVLKCRQTSENPLFNSCYIKMDVINDLFAIETRG